MTIPPAPDQGSGPYGAGGASSPYPTPSSPSGSTPYGASAAGAPSYGAPAQPGSASNPVQGMGGPASSPGSSGGAPSQKGGIGGFFGALFDLRFDRFVTPYLVRIVYVLAMVMCLIVLLVYLAGAVALLSGGEAFLGLLALLAAPVIALILLAVIRMSLEFYYAVIRISEDVHRGQQS